jgi:hypothetical protein
MRKLCAIYQDFSIWTPSSGRENCTSIYQNLPARLTAGRTGKNLTNR